MKPTVVRVFVCLLVACLTPACMLGGEEVRYRLIAPQVEAGPEATESVAHRSLAVARPRTDRTRDSSRILLRRDRTLLPWKGAAWIDRAPDLVQSLLIAHLDGRVATTGSYGSLPAGYRLDLVMRRFEFVETADGLIAELELVVRLFDAGGALLGATTVARSRPAAGVSVDRALPAMESTLHSAFEALADWLRPQLSGGGESPRPSDQ
jgi:ABC-type uncharacterized transport system auxiliary subunit